MNLQDLTLQQLKEILRDAPKGATHFTSDYINDLAPIYYFKEATSSDWNDWWIFIAGNWHSHLNKSLMYLNLADIRARIAEFEPKQKYDWSNVPDVVNWLATDKDGDCAWGFLEEPVIELEDEEWRPVAPYTEIYINGSTGTVAPYSGNWRESLEQRQFKIGDKVTFIRNIEPFQWSAKAKVYEVVDVADNLPTSTDQRVWLDTTASSPHLSRNLCLATAIGQVGIEDLPVHGEPISSEIITNVPVIDELEPVFKVGDRVVKKENNAIGEYAKSIVSYNPKTGIFTFLADAPVNKSLRGQEANSYFFKSKYKRIQLKKKTYLQHRLAWYFYYGVWPNGDIDHINGVRDDNRIANLRDVSKAINMQNQRKARSTNPTGFIGVRKRNRKLNPYNAQIKVNGRNIDLGVYKTPEEAHAAYMDAKRKYHEGCTL